MADRYKIYEQLGSGGMGAVFRAYDHDLRRWVAIKRLTSEKDKFGDDTLVGDLRREADALASLRNPNIVTIFDVATDVDGLFLVMELLEGEDLADVVARGPLHYDDFKELASQTLEALLAAHQCHILHRDIKPENVKVERLPGGRLQSKIIDFGLARAGVRAKKQTEDQSGTVMGSILYMAPEQLTREPVDERTDLYSLGCVFYEALSGQKAFDGPDVAAIIDKHINHNLIPLHVVAPHVPPWLGAWVLRLMARKPDDRPANAQQAIHELRAWEKIAAIPAVMPWMPGAYAPMPYSTQSYPNPAITSAVPVGNYYQAQTGQVLVHTYPTGQVCSIQPVAITGQASTLPTDQPPTQITQKLPSPVKPSLGTASSASRLQSPGKNLSSEAKSRASRTVPSASEQARIFSGQSNFFRNYGFWALGGLIAIVLFLIFQGINFHPKVSSPQDASKPVVRAAMPLLEKVHFQLPEDRQFPPQDDDLVLYLVAKLSAAKSSKNSNGHPNLAKEGEAAEAWHDLAEKAGANTMVSSIAGEANSPKHTSWSGHYLKSKRSAIDFRARGAVHPSFVLSDPGVQSEFFPFGKAPTKGPSGLTLCLVLQSVEKSLPMRIFNLSSEDGCSVTLDINDSKNVLATFIKGSASVTISSQDIDPYKPICVFVTWDRATKTAGLRIRDASGKIYSAKGASIDPPEKPLTRFALGKSQSKENSQSSSKHFFSGWISEVLLYASVLRPDQMQLLEGPNLRDYYWNTMFSNQ